DHAVLDERVVHLLERPLVERMGEVDAVDLGADVRGELLHPDRRVGHAGLHGRRAAADRRCQLRVVTRTTGVKAPIGEGTLTERSVENSLPSWRRIPSTTAPGPGPSMISSSLAG